MSLGSDLVDRILGLADLDLPWRKVKRMLIVMLAGSALLFPVTFRAGVALYIEEQSCSVERALVQNLILDGEKDEVAKSNGLCSVRFAVHR
jgi:hypothetical protein